MTISYRMWCWVLMSRPVSASWQATCCSAASERCRDDSIEWPPSRGSAHCRRTRGCGPQKIDSERNLAELSEPGGRCRARIVQRVLVTTINQDEPSAAVTSLSMAQLCSRLDVRAIVRVAGDVLRFVSSTLRPHAQLAAENLFLRKQLALYLERRGKPRRADDATRIPPLALARPIDRRRLPTVLQPGTPIRLHRR